MTIVASTGCNDFATPAELDRAQIIVMISDPPAVPLRESSLMTIVVADSNGEVTTADVQWEVSSSVPELPPLGSVEVSGDTVTYNAPNALPSLPDLALVQATVTVGDETLVGLKGVVIGPLQFVNPTITALTAAGTDVMTAGAIEVSAGDTIDLAVTLDPPADEMTTYAWYSTIGEIEQYRSTPTEFIAPAESGDGWLFVVARNDKGGATWHKVQLTVR